MSSRAIYPFQDLATPSDEQMQEIDKAHRERHEATVKAIREERALHLAMSAMNALLIRPSHDILSYDNSVDPSKLAKAAFDAAEAMLAEASSRRMLQPAQYQSPFIGRPSPAEDPPGSKQH